ncbi:MAG: sulfite exporter TauE/SafE family protein, partial [Pseudomonadales bacterium]
VGAGFWGGFIQIGVGFILMPILNRVMGLDLVRVNALKVFVILCYTIVALAIFATQVEVLWIAGLALALGNALGGWMGAHSSVTRADKLIRWVLNSVLVVFIIKLLFF